MAHAQDSPDDRGMTIDTMNMTPDDIAEARRQIRIQRQFGLWLAGRLEKPDPHPVICQEAAKLLRELVSG